MIRYYITDRLQLQGSISLVDCIRRNVGDGVDYIQIRERDLAARALYDLVVRAVAEARGSRTRILVNDRADVALAAGADGVHLRSDPVPSAVWRRIAPAGFLIGVSCHSVADVHASAGADFVVFGPVFQSPGKGAAAGLQALSDAVKAAHCPVLALGGITRENAAACIRAGAAGIAAIRLFQSVD